MSEPETHRRSLVKGLSYRFFGTLVTGVITYVMTGEPLFALKLGVIDTFAKVVVYYLHERMWTRIPYGKPPPPDYQI